MRREEKWRYSRRKKSKEYTRSYTPRIEKQRPNKVHGITEGKVGTTSFTVK